MFAALLASYPPASAAEPEWTRFRGPNGTGLSEAKDIPTTWTDADYNWTTTLPGVGHSSPVIWRQRVFLINSVEETAERIVICVDTESGKILWERRFPSSVHKKHLLNSFASATPAVDQDHLYCSWSSPEEYTILALDHAGRDVWRVNLGPVISQHSTAVSPVVFDGMVILGNDQDGIGKDSPVAGVSFLVALDCKDGHERWRTKRENAVVSYSTPCVRRLPGGKVEMIFNSQAHGITAIDPYTGAVRWELPVLDKRSVSSPVMAAGLIFGSTGSGGGGNYVAAVRPGNPPELAYKITKMAPYVPTLLAKDGLLFMWGDQGVVSCADAATGDIIWRERCNGKYSGSPICVRDHLYCLADDGTVVVIKASRDFEQVARITLGEEARSTPSVADGRIYFRTVSHLYSLGGKKVLSAR
ncbi:MAG: PQQ-binding-like beta-propeller repeat protein [Planctomycetes bacterium]|nr:PQQ-binding-like beta-propeller repeat protein [Planctomycetota bacterium]